jgi:hypothetical protein
MLIRKLFGLLLVVGGVLGMVVTLAGDRVGISQTPGRFGYLQAVALAVSILLLIGGGVVYRSGGSRPAETSPRRPAIRLRMISRVELVMVLASLGLMLIVCEIAVRILSETNQDGQVFVMDVPLKPYKLQVGRTRVEIDRYLASTDSYIIYDPDTGWAIRPNGTSDDGLYHANAAGLRANRDYPLEPPEDVTRIAIFGDSFTHGDDVHFEESWGYQLEQILIAQRYRVEVLNFGVGGFGMDQAYLRWQKMGCQYAPDVVLFGFQVENIYRNLNVIRSIYRAHTSVPFTKPRFVLEGDELFLVNSPALPPEDVPDTLANFSESPLSEYEYFYDEDYVDHWWLKSELLGFVLGALDAEGRSSARYEAAAFDPAGEPARLTEAIIHSFELEVEACDATFVVVHIPRRPDFFAYQEQGLVYADLLNALDGPFVVIHPERELATLNPEEPDRGHYTPEESRVLAEIVARELVDRHYVEHDGEGKD